MQRSANFIGGLVVGVLLSGSIAILHAQSANQTMASSPSAPAPFGRYQISANGPGIWLVDTTNGETFRIDSPSDGKSKWVPLIPPLSR